MSFFGEFLSGVLLFQTLICVLNVQLERRCRYTDGSIEDYRLGDMKQNCEPILQVTLKNEER